MEDVWSKLILSCTQFCLGEIGWTKRRSYFEIFPFLWMHVLPPAKATSDIDTTYDEKVNLFVPVNRFSRFYSSSSKIQFRFT